MEDEVRVIFYFFQLLMIVSSTPNPSISELLLSYPVGISSTSAISDGYLTSTSQLTATYYYSKYARINFPNARYSWTHQASSDSDPYLQIDLRDKWMLYKVATQGDAEAKFLHNFTLSYAMSDSNEPGYKVYTENGQVKTLTGNVDASTIVDNILNEPIRANYLRFHPVCCDGYALRVEAYGERLTGDRLITPSSRAFYDEGRTDNGFSGNAILSTGNGWTASHDEDWIAVDYGRWYKISVIYLQGRSNKYVTLFQLWYALTSDASLFDRDNEERWICYTGLGSVCMNITGSWDDDVVTYIKLDVVIETRHIMIFPLESESAPVVRFGAAGIPLHNPHPSDLGSGTHPVYTASSEVHGYPRNYARPNYMIHHGYKWASQAEIAPWIQVQLKRLTDVTAIKMIGLLVGSYHRATNYYEVWLAQTADNHQCVETAGGSCQRFFGSQYKNYYVLSLEMLDQPIAALYVKLVDLLSQSTSAFDQEIGDSHIASMTFDVLGQEAPHSCAEAQIRYGFPESGNFWLSVDSEAFQVECDMSVVPAATVLRHNMEKAIRSSRGRGVAANQEIGIIYSNPLDQVENIVNNSAECEMPFRARLHNSRLDDVYWRRERPFHHHITRRFTDPYVYDEDPDRSFKLSQAELAKFQADDYDAHIGASTNFYSIFGRETPLEIQNITELVPGVKLTFDAVGLGLPDQQYFLIDSPNKPGSHTLIMMLKIHAADFVAGALLYQLYPNGTIIETGPHRSQLRLTYKEVDTERIITQFNTPKYLLPIDVYFMLQLSFDADDGTFTMMVNCKNVYTKSFPPAVPEHEGTNYFGLHPEASQEYVNKLIRVDLSSAIISLNMATNKETCTMLRRSLAFLDTTNYIKDCADLPSNLTSGWYMVHPHRHPQGIQVYCDQDIDGGGWTVWYNREDDYIPFNFRPFQEYREGFYSPTSFFIGLEALHHITTSGLYEARFDMESYGGTEKHAVYEYMIINPEMEEYALHVGIYSGTAGDSLNTGRPLKFGSHDFGDATRRSCANSYETSNWVRRTSPCLYANLFGPYHSGSAGCEMSRNCPSYKGLVWHHFSNNGGEPLKRITAKLRRVSDVDSVPLSLVANEIPFQSFVGDEAGADYCIPWHVRFGTLCSIFESYSPGACGFCSSTNINPDYWLQVDMGDIHVVTALLIQARFTFSQYIKKFIGYHSLDGKTMECYKGTLPGSTTCQEISTNFPSNRLYDIKYIELEAFPPARYIRMVPLQVQSHYSSRLEIFVKPRRLQDFPSDCSDLESSFGSAWLIPKYTNQTFHTICHDGNSGERYTAVMQRTGPTTITDTLHNKTVEDLGSTYFLNESTGDHWRELDKWHFMTKYHSYMLRIEMTDFQQNTKTANYHGVKVMSKEYGYAIRVESYDEELSDAGDSLDHNNTGFDLGSCDSPWWYGSAQSCETTLTAERVNCSTGCTAGMRWRTFAADQNDTVSLDQVKISLLRYDQEYGGWNLPSQSYGGKYRAVAECRAFNARLFADGLEGQAAWCAPTDTVSDDSYLQVDLRATYFLSAVVTQGLASGRVIKYKLHLSKDGSTWSCYNDCEILEASSTEEFSYLRRNAINATIAGSIRFVRIIPTEFEIYPKIRVEFVMSLDASYRTSWKHETADLYGSLVDSPTKRSHPVGAIAIGGGLDASSYTRYKIAGPLRCYQSYKTCADVKLAGLPSGVYWLDPDRLGGNKPFKVHCSFVGHHMTGTVEHDSKDKAIPMTAGQREHVYYGGPSSKSYVSHTNHLIPFLDQIYMATQYGEMHSNNVDSWDWRISTWGSTGETFRRPGSYRDRICTCFPFSGCTNGRYCNTQNGAAGWQSDSGYYYYFGYSTAYKITPVTRFYASSGNGMNAYQNLGPVQHHFYGRELEVLQDNSYQYFSGAAARCASLGDYDLATLENLLEAWDSGYQSNCRPVWVKEGLSLFVTRTKSDTSDGYCPSPIKTHDQVYPSIGVIPITYNRYQTQAYALCSKRNRMITEYVPVGEKHTLTTSIPYYTDTVDVAVSLCDTYSPCKSFSKCVADAMYLYACHCVNPDDTSRNCTNGFPSCSVAQRDFSVPSGYMFIDPDGFDTGEDPFEVYCDMTRAPPLTRVGHNFECGKVYNGMSGYSGQYTLNIGLSYNLSTVDYLPAYTYDQMKGLVDNSAFCHQKMDYVSQHHKCRDFMRYWYGTSRIEGSNLKCDCYYDQSCESTHSSHGCGCETYGPNLYKHDTITITDKSRLPLTRIDIGHIQGTDQYIRVQLTALECIEGILLESCYDYLKLGYTTSGNYKLSSGTTRYCDMTEDYQVLSNPCSEDERWEEESKKCLWMSKSARSTRAYHITKCAEDAGTLAVIDTEDLWDIISTLPGYSAHWSHVNMYQGDPTNLAHGKPCTESSMHDVHHSCNKALDNKFANLWHPSGSHTLGWIKVDLETIYNITWIRFYLRPGHESRKKGMFIISSESDLAVDPTDPDWNLIWFEPDQNASAYFDFHLDPAVPMRYVAFGADYRAISPLEINYFAIPEVLVSQETIPEENLRKYYWANGRSEDDFAKWAANHPNRNDQCILFSISHLMKSWSCSYSDAYGICERQHEPVEKSVRDLYLESYESNILDRINENQGVDLEECFDESDPCSYEPCLNNGTCTANYFTFTYICICTNAFEGDRCQIPKLCPWPSQGIPTEGVNTTLVSLDGTEILIENEDSLIYGIPAKDYNFTVGSYLQHVCHNGTVVEGAAKRLCGFDLVFVGNPPICGELSSCIDYQLRCYPSGEYTLDFDGVSGPEPSITAWCDMSTTPPTTVVHHRSTCYEKIENVTQPKGHEIEVNYGADYQTIRALVERSSVCTQTLEYHCYRSKLSHNYGWIGADNSTLYSYFESSYQNRWPQCDYQDYSWRREFGTITETSRLPIRRLYFGGHIDENWSLGFLSVGSLQCQQGYRTCKDYENMGLSEGYYWVDPDGLSGTAPVYVKCEYDDESETAEVIFKHSYLTDIRYAPWRYWFGNAYNDVISYFPNTALDINAYLTHHALSATQRVDIRTYNARIYSGDSIYNSWLMFNGTVTDSFIGEPGRRECSCFDDNSCVGGKTCGANDFSLCWHPGYHIYDYGEITNKDYLPVSGFMYGDGGRAYGCYYHTWYGYPRYSGAAVGYLTAVIRNVAYVPMGEDCSLDPDLCGSLQCLSDDTCGCNVVNDAEDIVSPFTSQCQLMNPCAADTSPCANSGICNWDPWSDLRFVCTCVGNWGGTNCSLPGAVNGGWGAFSEYSECEGICGNGTQFRNRSCDTPLPQHGGVYCAGSPINSRDCVLTTPCPIDGGWSKWGNWSECSVTCGQGVAYRNRSCSDPEPQYGGQFCLTNGTSNETESIMCQADVLCPVHGNWSGWSNWMNCSVACGNGTIERNRTCNDPEPAYNGDDCTGNATESDTCVQYPCPIHGGWSVWTDWTNCSTTCENGTQVRFRQCDNPEPQYGGDNCTVLLNTTSDVNQTTTPLTIPTSTEPSSQQNVNETGGNQTASGADEDVWLSASGTVQTMTCTSPVMCPIDGNWTEWTPWSNCSDSCGVNCTIPCGNGTTERTRDCTNPPTMYGGLDCSGHDWENATCDLPVKCRHRFAVPPGAYLRNADYYWSFNEWADSGARQVFSNTGGYSFGLFNASASFIEQRNDSINNASTWYTVKFNKLLKQCIDISGFELENHTCIVNPKSCEEGLSMEIWLKMQREDLESDSVQTAIASGNPEDAGKGGVLVYTTANKVGVVVANGTHFWRVERNLPGAQSSWYDVWYNIAFRWRSDLGLQVFIDGNLLDEIPFPRSMFSGLSVDNKLFVGCGKSGTDRGDFSNLEMDELAFWLSYLPDKKLKWFTGAIIEPVVDAVFSYESQIELLVPPTISNKNPYYVIADIYEPCDDSLSISTGSAALINITRGHQSGLNLSQLIAPVEISGTTAVAAGADLDEMTVGVSVGFWLWSSNSSSGTTDEILSGSNWMFSITGNEMLLNAFFESSYWVNETEYVIMRDVDITFSVPVEGWTNIAMSFHRDRLVVYVDGVNVDERSNLIERDGSSLTPRAKKILIKDTAEEYVISDIVIWKRYLYEFEVYRFLGMSKTETFLYLNADYFWTTDYYVTSDLRSMKQWRPLYKTYNSSVRAVSNAGIQGHEEKGQAMEIREQNGWAMLGLHDTDGVFTHDTGLEFAGTCLSDPDLCDNGLTVALWLKIYDFPLDGSPYPLITSGEEDELSRGFSITIRDRKLVTSVVDGRKYYSVSLSESHFQIGSWIHVAFTWKNSDGLWVFINGELKTTQLEGFPENRPYDRYSRITLGRSNKNNNFGSFLNYAFQEIAVYLRFLSNYEIREYFALTDNSFYETADYYWNKDTLITSTLGIIQSALQLNSYVGPLGLVLAHNNTVNLNEGASINLKYEAVASSCLIDPKQCGSLGFTVSVWARNNLMIENNVPIFIASSHTNPEAIRDGSKRGWTLYFVDLSWMATVTSDTETWNIALSELSPSLIEQRWTNLAISWSPATGLTMFMDGQVAGLMKTGQSVTAGAPSGSENTPMIGNPNSDNTTFIGVFNLAFWKESTYKTSAYKLTGHEAEQIEKYSKSNLMWTFDGPIDKCNSKYDEMDIPLKTYDDTYKGAAVAVTRDAKNPALLGDYSKECLTQPSSCQEGFQMGMKIKLTNYVAGLPPDDVGMVFLLGSPDANFEGLAIQQYRHDYTRKNMINVIIANDVRVWSREIEIPINVWFDFVIGWNVKDGIQIKLDNEKVSGSGRSRRLSSGSAKLKENILMLGIGSGGGGSQAVSAWYNDITITYNSEVAIEQEGRCYDSAEVYYRLNKGQIFTMVNVLYIKDRENLVNSAFLLRNGFVELEDFPDNCLGDPSFCTYGLSVSFYVKLLSVHNNTRSIMSSGFPTTRGYRVSVDKSLEIETDAVITVELNNGAMTWSAQVPVTQKEWVNVAFTWNDTEAVGLNVFVNGQLEGYDAIGVPDIKPLKTNLFALVVGRGSAVDDEDFCDAAVDDVALWSHDVSMLENIAEDTKEKILIGSDCGENIELVEAAQRQVEVTDPFVEEFTLKPPNCVIWIPESGICAVNVTDLNNQIVNSTVPMPIDTFRDALIEVEVESSHYNESSSNPMEELESYVETLSLLPRLPIPENIDPEFVEQAMKSVLGITSNILNPEVWGPNWNELNANGSDSANILKYIEKLAVGLVENTQLGLDKEDDCTTLKASAPNILMSCEKRRLMLCPRPFVFPQYNELSLDPGINKTLEDWNIPTDQVTIPSIMWDKSKLPDDTLVTVTVVLYDNIEDALPEDIIEDEFKPSTTASADASLTIGLAEGKRAKVKLNSRVMSISASPPPGFKNGECIKVTLEHKRKNKGNKDPVYCTFWDYEAKSGDGAWSTEGCTTNSNETHTVCCCNHLTSFAVMMETLEEEEVDAFAQYIGYANLAGTGFSLFSLLMFMLIVLCNKSLRSERNMVHLNLCISMMLALIFYICVDYAVDIQAFCQAIAIGQHYFFMVAYAWVFIEALCLFYAVLYGELMGKMKGYAPFAWGVPAVIVGALSAFYHDKYGLNERCWLTFNDYLILAMVGPILLFLVLNLTVLLIVVCNLPQPSLKRADILSEIRSAVRWAIILAPLLAFIWIIALLQVTRIVAISATIGYVFTFLFSLQGVLIFLVYGLGQRSIRTAIMMKKYQPANSNQASRVLIRQGGSLSSNDSLRDDLVEVKPQPMRAPTAKDRVSPRAMDPSSRPSSRTRSSRGQTARRRPSTPDDAGYIP